MSHRNPKRLLSSRPVHQALLCLGLLGFCVPAWATTPPTFASPVDSQTGKGPRHVAIVDLNKDGLPDVVTASEADHTLSVLLGTKTGKLSEPKTVTLPAGLTTPTGVAAGVDFNLDGHLDIAVVGNDILAAYSGDGKGGFLSKDPLLTSIFSPSVDLRELIIVELDESHTPDFASIMGKGPGDFMTLLPLANGETRLFNDTKGSPVGIAGGEITGDGHDDIVTVDANGIVTLLSGKGDGTYYPIEDKKYPTHDNASRIALGDVTGDGKPDAVVAGDGFVSVLAGDGNGNFGTASNSDTEVNAKALVLADFSGDGVLDVAVASGTGPDVTVLVNQGEGAFAEPTVIATQGNASALAAGDFNEDGKPDLVVLKEQAHVAAVFLNTTGNPEPDPEADASVKLITRRVLGVRDPYILYEVRVTNNGPAKLDSATVTASMPQLTPTEGDCTKVKGSATCEFTDVAPGTMQSRSFRIPLKQFRSGRLYSIAVSLSDSDPEDPDVSNNQSTRQCIALVGLIAYCY